MLTGPLSLTASPDSPSCAPERLVVDGVDLDHAAHRDPLGELVAPAGHGRPVADPAGDGRRHGQDGPAGRHRPAAGLDHHPALAVADHLGRGAEHDPLAQRLGQPDRDGLGALVEAALLGAAGGADQQGHAARRADEEQGVQQRHVARLGGQRPPDDLPQPGPGTLGRHPGLEPGLDRLGVPDQRVRGRPGRLQRHPGRHGLQLADGLAHGDRAHRVAPRRGCRRRSGGPGRRGTRC